VGSLPLPHPVERIAVLRALQLGDLLCAVPALRALRARFPDAEITLVGLPWARELAARLDRYVDRFLALPGWPGLPERETDVAALPAFLREAHAFAADLVVQLHGSGEHTNALAYLLGGRATAGFRRPGGWCPDPRLFVPYPDDLPEPLRLLRLTEHLGAPPRGEHLEFPVTGADRRDAAALVGDSPYAVVHAGARLLDRRWDPAGFAAVADVLAAGGLRVALTGSEPERPLVDGVAASMRAPALDLAGRTSLGALAALLEGAELLVCNDTGVSHLAAALGVRSVVVFSVSDPVRWAPLDRDLHRPVPAAAGPEGIVRAAEEALRAA
jgi:ADP-heptose:LPS heptosyltransferase